MAEVAGTGVILNLRDATDTLLAESPNRAYLLDRVATWARIAAAPQGYALIALAVVPAHADVEHDAALVGPEALRYFGQLATETLREVDTCAYLGGGEFGLFATGISDRSAALAVAMRLQGLARRPLPLEDRRYPIRLAIGVTFAARNATPPETLLGYAEVALARARGDGHGSTAYFAPGMDNVEHAWLGQERRGGRVHASPPYRTSGGIYDEHDPHAPGRARRAEWYAAVARLLLGALETFLAIRVLFKLIGAQELSWFATLLYAGTGLAVAPFRGIVASPRARSGIEADFPTIIAMAIYAIVGLLAIHGLQLFIAHPAGVRVRSLSVSASAIAHHAWRLLRVVLQRVLTLTAR